MAFDISQSPPVPRVDDRNRFYWDAIANGRIDLLKCRNCGHFVHFPRPICDHCRSADLAPETISGRGRLYSYCEINQVGHPYFADKVPYVIGVIDIDEEPGIRIPAGLVDCTYDELTCDIAMEAVFRSVTPSLDLVFFRPTSAQG